jgi:hypothetical protein
MGRRGSFSTIQMQMSTIFPWRNKNIRIGVEREKRNNTTIKNRICGPQFSNIALWIFASSKFERGWIFFCYIHDSSSFIVCVFNFLVSRRQWMNDVDVHTFWSNPPYFLIHSILPSFLCYALTSDSFGKFFLCVVVIVYVSNSIFFWWNVKFFGRYKVLQWGT